MPVRRQPPATRATPAGTWRASRRFAKLRQPPTVPITAYRAMAWTPIPNGAASVVLDSTGSGTAQVGPQGLGTVWRVTQAGVSTTTGTTDASTATVYAGTEGLATLLAAQSYAGGGDTAGLNDVELTPGLYVVCTWTGGVSGAVATLVVYGTQRAMTVA